MPALVVLGPSLRQGGRVGVHGNPKRQRRSSLVTRSVSEDPHAFFEVVVLVAVFLAAKPWQHVAAVVSEQN